jgi:hypothetical protein
VLKLSGAQTAADKDWALDSAIERWLLRASVRHTDAASASAKREAAPKPLP